MRRRPATLGALMCLSGLGVVPLGADGLRTGDHRRLLIVFAGVMLVLLGVGLVRDARRPRAARRPDGDSGGDSIQPSAGDVSCEDVPGRGAGDGGSGGGS